VGGVEGGGRLVGVGGGTLLGPETSGPVAPGDLPGWPAMALWLLWWGWSGGWGGMAGWFLGVCLVDSGREHPPAHRWVVACGVVACGVVACGLCGWCFCSVCLCVVFVECLFGKR
jgi:hypothetical protein